MAGDDGPVVGNQLAHDLRVRIRLRGTLGVGKSDRIGTRLAGAITQYPMEFRELFKGLHQAPEQPLQPVLFGSDHAVASVSMAHATSKNRIAFGTGVNDRKNSVAIGATEMRQSALLVFGPGLAQCRSIDLRPRSRALHSTSFQLA